MTAASFEPVSPIVFVAQKFCSEPSRNVRSRPFSLSARLNVFFQADGQKTLDEILRFGRSVTPKSQKGVKGWPIRFTEIGKRFSSLFPLDRTVERARPESSASIETPLLLPAMFQVSVS